MHEQGARRAVPGRRLDGRPLRPELLIDQAARVLDIDPVELRRRNLVRPDEFPYESCTGMVYDSGSFRESLTGGVEAIGYDDFRAEQRSGRGEGRLLGIGVSPYVEPTGWGTEGQRPVELGPRLARYGPGHGRALWAR